MICWSLSWDIYEAIYIPEGVQAPPKSIINTPELQVYAADFGKKEDDICYLAEVNDKVVGAVWVRVMDDYGHMVGFEIVDENDEEYLMVWELKS